MDKRTKARWPRTIRQTLIIQGVALSLALILYIYGSVGQFGRTLFISLITSNLSWLSIRLLVKLFRLPWHESRPWDFRFTLKSIAVFYLGMTLGLEVSRLVVAAWYRVPFFPFVSLWHLYIYGMNLAASVVVVLLIGLYQNMKFRLERRNREFMELENLQIKTRLAALQAKLNPHFLFNTLNVILDLATQAPDKIEPVVLNLSDIYRTVLNQAENENSTVGQEVELVRKYLEIERLRLGKRLAYRFDWDDSLAPVPLPPLLIEPLVENAVIHGISPKEEGGEIVVRLKAAGRRMEIEIADTGVGLSGGHTTQGFGLHSVRERLHLLYGQGASMTISSPPGGGTLVRLEVPLAA